MYKKGFTLVELAIVMTIIGLLIGGILKGQKMLENAKVKNTVKILESTTSATYSFRDMYGNIPGDFSLATTRLPNCNVANFCVNGDGNGIIGIVSGATQSQGGTASFPRVETSMYWKHLVLADLISGVTPSADPTQAEFGKTHPAIPILGGLAIYYHDTRARNPNTNVSGHFMTLSSTARGSGSYHLPANQIYLLDKAIDDGMPNTGTIMVEYVGSGCKTNDTPTGEYQYTNNGINCIVWYYAGF
jgi:prepilin-type N-terminal cleavage/methylation domain-containing protein